MGRSPKKGKPIAFKPTEEMRASVEEIADKEGVGLSELARRSVDLYKDLYEKLGGDWHEADRRSGVYNKSIGTILASLVKAALEQERKSKNH